MKKLFKTFGIIFISFLILCVTVSFADRGLFYRIWYFGDRITININAEINNQSVQINNAVYKDDHNIEYRRIENLREKDGKTILSIPADSYGAYTIRFSINSNLFYLELYQFNWWDVQKIDLDLKIDTKNYMVYYNVKHKSLNESAAYYTCYDNGEYPLDKSYNSIWIYK